MDSSIREMLERERRAKLHRQIGALVAQLEYIGRPLTRWEVARRAKLSNKIARLEAALHQPMLIDLGRPRGAGVSP